VNIRRGMFPVWVCVSVVRVAGAVIPWPALISARIAGMVRHRRYGNGGPCGSCILTGVSAGPPSGG
jgi:hypothetical protein